MNPGNAKAAIKQMSAVFERNNITMEDAIKLMAAFTVRIGKNCGDEAAAASMMINALSVLIPDLADKITEPKTKEPNAKEEQQKTGQADAGLAGDDGRGSGATTAQPDLGTPG